jgi:Ser-tRNA(Ala) deacylase AlaX
MNTIQTTYLKYMDDTFCFASLAIVTEVGSDEHGTYLVLDQTIHYPGGGGQPEDLTYLQKDNVSLSKVIKSSFNSGNIKHYIDSLLQSLKKGDEVAIKVDRTHRIRNAAYHSAGHWVSSIVTENIMLPLLPIKGFHYPEGAYVEFDGDIKKIPDDILYQIEYAMRIDRQAQLKIKASIVEASEFLNLKDSIVVPSNFEPMDDRPLRLVTFDTYKSVPCGGTHLSSVLDFKMVKPTKIKLKNGKIRISYLVEMPDFIPPS